MSEKQEWLPAVQAEMRTAALAEAQKHAGRKTPSFLYRWEHVRAVVTTAVRLAHLLDADEEVVTAAAWLHDVKKFEAKGKHPQAGAEFAREFLPQTDFPAEKIETVAEAIAQHMGLWRDEPAEGLAAQILWDADKLTKIGRTAAFQWVGRLFSGTEKAIDTEKLVAFGQQPDWQEKTIASMHTEPARRAAEERLAAYRSMWDGLEIELHGRDLM